jgi:hypothetical protein
LDELLSFLQEYKAVTIKKTTAKVIRLIGKNFMTILLGFMENINATLEAQGAGKFNEPVKNLFFRRDEVNNRVYKDVFLRNGQAGLSVVSTLPQFIWLNYHLD